MKLPIKKPINEEKLKNEIKKEMPDATVDFGSDVGIKYMEIVTNIPQDRIEEIIEKHDAGLAKVKQINFADLYNAREKVTNAIDQIIDTIEAGHERLIALETAHKKLQSIVVSNAKNVVGAYKESEEKT